MLSPGRALGNAACPPGVTPSARAYWRGHVQAHLNGPEEAPFWSSRAQLTSRKSVSLGTGIQGQAGVPATFSAPGTSFTLLSFVSLSTSCSEDCCHKEEAAAVHRALQVAPQLSQPLVRLLRPGVCRAHQPGTLGSGQVTLRGTAEPRRTCRSNACPPPVLRGIFIFFSKT